MDETQFGPDITQTFKGEVGSRRDSETMEITVTFPEWCIVTVYRMVGDQRVKFSGPKVYWLESYGRRGKSEVPNEMWFRRPHGQVEKCSEAGALRRAFPEEIGNEYAAEEMEGQRIIDHVAAPVTTVPPPPPPPPARIAAQVAVPMDLVKSPEPAAIASAAVEPAGAVNLAPQPLTPAALPDDGPVSDAVITDWIDRLKAADRNTQEEIFDGEIEPVREAGRLFPPDYNRLIALIKDA
jgi:hypothetical protein